MVAGGAVVMGAGDWITPFAGVGAGGAPSEGGTDADGDADRGKTLLPTRL